MAACVAEVILYLAKSATETELVTGCAASETGYGLPGCEDLAIGTGVGGTGFGLLLTDG